MERFVRSAPHFTQKCLIFHDREQLILALSKVKANFPHLADCTVKYEFVSVDTLHGEERKAILEVVLKYHPDCFFHTMITGNLVIVGFNEDEIRRGMGCDEKKKTSGRRNA